MVARYLEESGVEGYRVSAQYSRRNQVRKASLVWTSRKCKLFIDLLYKGRQKEPTWNVLVVNYSGIDEGRKALHVESRDEIARDRACWRQVVSKAKTPPGR